MAASALQSVQNAAVAASNAIFGTDENKQEPRSGQTGDVSKGEPYDAGNIDGTQAKTDSTTSAPGTGPGSASEATSGSATGPHKTLGSSVTGGDLSKGQQDTRSPSDPTVQPETAKKRTNVDTSTSGPDTDDNPVKVDGPGPKSVEELAHERGGDAGNISSSSSVDKTADNKSGQEKPAEEDDDGPQKISHGTGTGEQYVKSTGLQADGGDFDATKPGAGKEADRLLETKGIHPTGGNKAVDEKHDDPAKPATSKHEKPTLGEKIKAKLHKSHAES